VRISIVIPVLNEEACIGALIGEIIASLPAIAVHELIVVDDGSTDDTQAVVRKIMPSLPQLRLVSHTSRCGQSAAMSTGIRLATGELIVTMDGDGQNNPADIPKLIDVYTVSAVSHPQTLVAGQRVKRQDTLMRRISSRIANAARRAVLDDGVRDTGCSLKLFRREDFLALPQFNHIHRFIPALMKAAGVSIVLVDVSHRPRTRGSSKYGILDRLWVGIPDLFGVCWLIRRRLPSTQLKVFSS